MITLRFRGYSDDTFEVHADTGADVDTLSGGIDNCASCEPIQCVITAGGTSLIVTGQYNRMGTGTWDIGISLYDEELSAPEWDIRTGFEDYSTVVEMDVPDDVELTWYNNGVRLAGDDTSTDTGIGGADN